MNSVTLLLILLFVGIASFGLLVYLSDRREEQQRRGP